MSMKRIPVRNKHKDQKKFTRTALATDSKNQPQLRRRGGIRL